MHTPPKVALLLCIGFVFYLFRRDFRESPHVTRALWLPLIWMLLIGSRSVVQWFALFGIFVGAGSMEEGNPLDAFIYFGLIVAGCRILHNRRVTLAEVFRNNGWLMVFLLYCFLAIFWSDFPFIAFKRWIKILGHPVMVLILLTEPDPEEAVSRLMKRTAYVLVPFSILFIKYFPEYGRGFDEWTGAGFNLGVMGDKNQLGWVCLILGYFFLWHLLKTFKVEKSRARRNELLLTCAFLYLIWWLLSKSSSATSVFSLVTGAVIMMVLGLPLVSKRMIGLQAILIVSVLVIAQAGFEVFDHVIAFSGHDATIAGRAELWRELLAFRTNPIIGVGFESFWLGDRLRALWTAHWWHPNEAHNGYLETYLNLGLIGLFLLFGMLIATFRKIAATLLHDLQFGRFRMGFLAAVIVFNWTETTFKGLSLIWFVFYIIAMDYPRIEYVDEEEPADETDWQDRAELTYHEQG